MFIGLLVALIAVAGAVPAAVPNQLNHGVVLRREDNGVNNSNEQSNADNTADIALLKRAPKREDNPKSKKEEHKPPTAGPPKENPNPPAPGPPKENPNPPAPVPPAPVNPAPAPVNPAPAPVNPAPAP
ncbi:hypothetical protein HDU77_001155, partial [Chytriomyces hyalinus]